MRQLLLDVRPNLICSLENFEPGNNIALLTAIEAQRAAHDGSLLYLWGPLGSGRSHLLQATTAACAAQRPVQYATAHELAALELAPGSLLALDDVDKLDAEAQAALFRIMVSARENGLSILISGAQPPATLNMRQDVQSRLAQALVFEIQTLDEAQRSAIFNRHAHDRGLVLEDGILAWLLRHGRRDLPWLLAVLDALDEVSLTYGRRITLPLLRELLQGNLFESDSDSA